MGNDFVLKESTKELFFIYLIYKESDRPIEISFVNTNYKASSNVYQLNSLNGDINPNKIILFSITLDSYCNSLLLKRSNDNFSATIPLVSFNQNVFAYDVSFDQIINENDLLINPIRINNYPSHYVQFKYFINYLNNNKNIDALKDTLLQDSIAFLAKSKSFQFDFFLVLYINTYNTPFILSLLKQFSLFKVISMNSENNNEKLVASFRMINEIDLNRETSNQNEQLLLLNQFHLIQLYYYETYSCLSFYDFLLNSCHPQILLSQILFFSNYFCEIDYNSILFLSSFANNKEEVYGLLKLIKSFYHLCLFISKSKTKLFYLFEKESLEIGDYIRPSSNDNLEEIFSMLYLFTFIKFSFLKWNYYFIDKYLEIFTNNNIENLYLIKEYLAKITKYGKLSEINNVYCGILLKKINVNIHITGKKMIVLKTISVLECITLFLNDKYVGDLPFEAFYYIVTQIPNGQLEEILKQKNGLLSCWNTINEQLANKKEIKTTYININNLAKIGVMLEISYNIPLFSLNQLLLLSLLKFYSEYLHHTMRYTETTSSKTFFLLIKEIYNELSIKNNLNFKLSNLINPIVISCIVNIIKGVGLTAMIRNSLAIEYFATSDNTFNILNIITTSIKRNNDLLLICNSRLLLSLLCNHFEKNDIDYLMLINSKFKEKNYYKDICHKINIYCQKNATIIFDRYASMADQLYSYIKEIQSKQSNNCRLVFICNEEEFKAFDNSFVNQFEVNMLKWKFMLIEKEINECNQVFNLIQQISTANNNADNNDNISHLINCTIEHIQLIKYFNKGCNTSELISLVLKKIVPLFSQDLIVFIADSLLKANYPDLVNTILEIYNKGKHQNITHYFSSMENSVNIVFTFSSIKDKLNFPVSINNKLIGEINADSIEEDLSREARTEHSYDNLIHSFYINKNKIMIIRLEFHEWFLMEHIKCLIENYENYNQIQQKKCFVFIIHLQKAKDDSNLIDYSNYISDNDIFIDNLKGNDILITNLISKNTKDIITDKSFINFETVYNENITRITEYIEFMFYSFGKTKELKSLILNNAEDIKSIIIDELSNEKSLLSYSKSQTLKTNNIALMSIISFNVETKYVSCLIKTIINLFSGNTINFSDNKRLNSFSIKVDFLCDCFKHRYALIQGIKYSQILIKEYHDCEDFIKRSNYDNNDISTKVLNEFRSKERFMSNAILFEISHELEIAELNNLSLNDLMKSYFLLFLTKKCGFYNDEISHLLLSILNLRYSEDSNSLCKSILWIETNSELITILIEIYLLLLPYNTGLFQNIIMNIKKSKQSLESLFIYQHYKRCFVEPFLIPLQILIKIALTTNEVIEKLSQQKFQEFMNNIKAIEDKCNKIEFLFQFQSNELTVLHNFIIVNDIISNNTHLSQKILQYLNIFSMNRDRNILDNKNQLIKNLFEEEALLSSLIGLSKDYSKIMINILTTKYKIVQDQSYHKAIAEVAMKANNVLTQSDKLLNLFFNKYMIYSSFRVENIVTIFISLSQTKAIDLEPFEKANEKTHKLILNFFKKKMYLYVNEQPSIKKKLFGIQLELLTICLQGFENISLDNINYFLPNLTRLYYLAYLQIYLQNYVLINYSFNAEAGDFASINKIILGESNTQFRETIKLFILKLFRTHFGSIDEMRKFKWELHQIDWINQYDLNECLTQNNFNTGTTESYLKYFKNEQYDYINELNHKLSSNSNNSKQYPVLTTYLQCKDSNDYKILINLSKINPLVNYMIDKYSYYTSREEFSTVKINKIIDKEDIKPLYDSFLFGLNTISNVSIDEEKSMSFLINDFNLSGGGNYLYDIYAKAISLQNNFLYKILNQKIPSKSLTNLGEIMNNKILIQDATISELLCFTINQLNSDYHSFDDLLFTLANNNHDYLDSIEEELQDILLKGKRLFSEKQKTVVYLNENLMSQSSVNSNYIIKYQQSINETEAERIVSALTKQPNIIGKIIMALTQIIPLIYIGNYPQKTSIKELIDSLSLKTEIPSEIKDILIQTSILNVNNIITVYNKMENKSIDSIKHNSTLQFASNFSNESKEVINEYFINESKVKRITKKALAAALIKFIQELNQTKNNNIDLKSNLFKHISLPEYWDNKEMLTELKTMENIIQIEANEALALYSHLVKEDEITKTVNEVEKSKTLKKNRFIY